MNSSLLYFLFFVASFVYFYNFLIILPNSLLYTLYIKPFLIIIIQGFYILVLEKNKHKLKATYLPILGLILSISYLISPLLSVLQIVIIITLRTLGFDENNNSFAIIFFLVWILCNAFILLVILRFFQFQ